jgi:hypothetical protein
VRVITINCMSFLWITHPGHKKWAIDDCMILFLF